MGFDGRDVVRRQALMRLHLQLLADRTQAEAAMLERPPELQRVERDREVRPVT
jgi:hypothetical protein